MSITQVARKVAPYIMMAVLFLGITGCGEGEKLPAIKAEDVIQKAGPAILAPKSFHFSLTTDNMHNLPGLWLTKADGDVLKPDKMRGKISARNYGLTFTSDIVVDGESQYWTDPLSEKWAPMPSYFNVRQLFNPAKGALDILASVKGLSNDGDEKIDNVASYRMKGSVPPASLKALTPEVNVKNDIPTTLWVGGKDFLLRRVRLEGALIEGEPANIVRTITISDYDKEVKLETPVVK